MYIALLPLTNLLFSAEQVNVPIYKEPDNQDPVSIALQAIAHAQMHNHDVVIVDTAGRLSVDEKMMEEIANIKEGDPA